MKFFIASDIHGSAFYAEKLLECYRKENADKLILLGDILYHGPRNDLPQGYNPKEVARLLNALKEEILCVRGNCEAEVDQLMLDFPVLAEYGVLFVENRQVYLAHGHRDIPSLPKDSILISGHTHVSVIEQREDYLYLNPGSVSIPKGNGIHSYMVYENNTFTLKNLEGEVLNYVVLDAQCRWCCK